MSQLHKNHFNSTTNLWIYLVSPYSSETFKRANHIRAQILKLVKMALIVNVPKAPKQVN